MKKKMKKKIVSSFGRNTQRQRYQNERRQKQRKIKRQKDRQREREKEREEKRKKIVEEEDGPMIVVFVKECFMYFCITK